MNRPVGSSRISASSSQESHNLAATSATSRASCHTSALLAAGRRPKSRASASEVDTSGLHPARPRLTQSRVATAEDTWNGSVWVVFTTGTSPIRSVAGATRDSTASASSPARAKESPSVTKSSVPCSARRASRTKCPAS